MRPSLNAIALVALVPLLTATAAPITEPVNIVGSYHSYVLDSSYRMIGS